MPPKNVVTLETSINRDPSLLYPVFFQKVNAALAHARLDGYPIAIFEGWRSPQRQDWLFAQGRTRAGNKVTNAKAWQSFHQFGLAVDVALNINGKWSWEIDFAKIAPYFAAEGLHNLGAGDPGHFEMNKGLAVSQAYALMQSSGLQRLWLEVAA